MERRLESPTFADHLTADAGGIRSAKLFEACERLIPFEELAASIGDLYERSGPDRGGRPHWPIVLMLKCLLIQKWFNLSDPMLEEMLRDRLSFRRFVGLSLHDETPDETTFVRFRQRLQAAGHASTLFDTTVSILEGQGVILKEGTLVDATVIETSKGRVNEKGEHTRDPAASATRMYGRTYIGFKAHVATDPRGMIKDYRFDTARVHDSQHIDDLVREETHAVWADNAYTSEARREELAARGVFAGIVYRRKRGQAELTPSQQAMNWLVRKKRAPVEHPFAWMKNRGYRKARYRGLIRNAFDFAMWAISYNWHRSLRMPSPA